MEKLYTDIKTTYFNGTYFYVVTHKDNGTKYFKTSTEEHTKNDIDFFNEVARTGHKWESFLSAINDLYDV